MTGSGNFLNLQSRVAVASRIRTFGMSGDHPVPKIVRRPRTITAPAIAPNRGCGYAVDKGNDSRSFAVLLEIRGRGRRADDPDKDSGRQEQKDHLGLRHNGDRHADREDGPEQ